MLREVHRQNTPKHDKGRSRQHNEKPAGWPGQLPSQGASTHLDAPNSGSERNTHESPGKERPTGRRAGTRTTAEETPTKEGRKEQERRAPKDGRERPPRSERGHPEKARKVSKEAREGTKDTGTERRVPTPSQRGEGEKRREASSKRGLDI